MRSSIAKIFFVTVVCVIAVCSIRCKDSCTGQPAALAATPAHVRFLHASPDAPAVDLLFNSTVIESDATFNTYTATTCCYRDCPATGSGTLFANFTGSANKLASTATQLVAGNYYTVVLLNFSASARLLVLRDTLATPTPDSARIRIIHAVPDLSSMDAYLAGKPVVQGLAFGQASRYVTVHTLLPSPLGTDTGSFVATRGGLPNDEIVQLQSGHVVITGQNVFTIIVLGVISPNGVEPLPTISVFVDNQTTTRGLGDVFLKTEFGALRIFNGTPSPAPLQLEVYNNVSADNRPLNWRNDFPGQESERFIGQDSMADYFLLGFTPFLKDAQGFYQIAVRSSGASSYTVFTDSVLLDPFLPDHRYTIAVLGDQPYYSIVILHDTTAAPPSGEASIRFLNGSTDSTQTISVSGSTGNLFSNTAYKTVSAEQTIPSGTTTFTLQQSGGASVQCTATLQSGETYTLIALGNSSDQTFRGKVYAK